MNFLLATHKMKDRISTLKDWIASTPGGSKRLNRAYETYKSEAKRLRAARKNLPYIPNYEDYEG